MYEETDATKWCLGLLLVEERQMTIFERAALTREGTTWGRKTWWAWGIYGTSIALFLLFAVNFESQLCVSQRSTVCDLCFADADWISALYLVIA